MAGAERKGQHSLDFLMDYGWMLLLVLLLAGASVSLGIIDVNQMLGSKAVGFSGVRASGFMMHTDGTLFLRMTNEAGVPITLNYLNATYPGYNRQVNQSMNSTLGPGKTLAFQSLESPGLALSPGDSFTVEMVIGYTDNKNQANYTSVGTLVGTVQDMTGFPG